MVAKLKPPGTAGWALAGYGSLIRFAGVPPTAVLGTTSFVDPLATALAPDYHQVVCAIADAVRFGGLQDMHAIAAFYASSEVC